MVLLEVLVIGVLIGLIPAAIAYGKGHNFFGWWIYGALLFIVALPHAILTSRNSGGVDARQLSTGESKKCPFCAELIKREALVCRYCSRDLPVRSAGRTASDEQADAVNRLKRDWGDRW